MKRLLLILGIAALSLSGLGVMSSPHTAQASRPAPKMHIYAHRLNVRSVPSRTHADRLALQSDARTTALSAVQSNEQLRLPASAFPSLSVVMEDNAETASDADGSAFSTMHLSSYTSLGMEGGWLQYYATKLGDGSFDVAYLGSYYPDAQAAGRAFADVTTNPQFSHGLPCSMGDQCYQDTIGVSFPDGDYEGSLFIVRSNNALAEISSVVPAADFSTDRAEIDGNVQRAAGAFLLAAQSPVPTAPPTSTPIPPTSTVLPATSTLAPTATGTPIPPTPSPTPTPTTTPAGHPKAATVLRASLKAMSRVHQLHAEGTLTDGFGAKHALRFTADCDIPAQKIHFLGHQRDSHGTLTEVEIIKIRTNAWARTRTGQGAWSKWIALKGDAQLLLIYVVPQSCPQFKGQKFGVPPHLMNVGPSTVDGVATWHLQAHSITQGEPFRLNIYVDQRTSVWRRYAGSQIAPKKKDTVVEDTRYSQFGVPVTISAPTG